MEMSPSTNETWTTLMYRETVQLIAGNSMAQFTCSLPTWVVGYCLWWKPSLHCCFDVKFLHQKAIINKEVYYKTLRKLCCAIQSKAREMLSQGIVLFMTTPGPAKKTQDLIKSFGWEQFDHPLYSPDLAPSDLHLFFYQKRFLAGQCFDEDDDVKAVMQGWL